MQRIVTAVASAQLASVDFNNFQDQAASASTASKNNALTGAPQGLDSRFWINTPANLANATTVRLDNSFSWQDRICPIVVYADLGDAAAAPGGAQDMKFGGVPVTTTLVSGYLGKGAQKGAGGQVVSGSPPVIAAGTSWAIEIVANLWLYADSFDSYALYLYNNTGGLITCPWLFVMFTAPTGFRP